MAQEYANQKGQGYNNHIQKIALVGATGQVGKFILESLLKSNVKHQITVLTREETNHSFPEGVQVKKVNYDDKSSIVSALQGQEAVVLTLAVTVPKDLSFRIIEAAAEANVSWILPNEWGYFFDESNLDFAKESFLGETLLQNRALVEKLGKSSWIALCCGFWYEYSLSVSKDSYGFDLRNKSVTFYDDGNTRMSTSTWQQTGLAVAKVLGLKILPENENDKTPSLVDYRNKPVCIQSFNISQKDMFESILRVTGDQEKDWTITYEPVKDRYTNAVQALMGGNSAAFIKLLYSRSFYPGSGNFEGKRNVENDNLGLPKEDLDERTKIAVEMAAANFNPLKH
eukprot:TRINITY_DN2356_c0_g1_i1.p1 TRINITY_DN2356_c0_g1~~TRINITY_DN2356_c0_g1_i1.p1  ORF type:complete len:341 (+),score=77.46 TRINITY_DN2356_c0_g1_i1:85-1107(+)